MQITLLEKVQRSFTRRIFYRADLSYVDYESRLLFLNLQSLEHRRLIRDLVFLYKCTHNLVHLDTSNLYVITPSSRNFRGEHSFRLSLPFRIPGTKRSSVLSRTIDMWNRLPSATVNALCTKQFSQLISTQL